MRTDKAAQLEEIRKLEKKCENGHGSASKIKRKRKRKRGRGARRNDKTGRAIDDRPTVGGTEEAGSCVVSCPYGGRERASDRMGVGTPSVGFADSSSKGEAKGRRSQTSPPKGRQGTAPRHTLYIRVRAYFRRSERY